MRAWHVYLGWKRIDIVFYTKDCGSDYVRDSLVNHDGYNPNIVIVGE